MKPIDRLKHEAQAKFHQWRNRRIDGQQAVNQTLARAKGRGACIHISQLNGVVQ